MLGWTTSAPIPVGQMDGEGGVHDRMLKVSKTLYTCIHLMVQSHTEGKERCSASFPFIHSFSQNKEREREGEREGGKRMEDHFIHRYSKRHIQSLHSLKDGQGGRDSVSRVSLVIASMPLEFG